MSKQQQADKQIVKTALFETQDQQNQKIDASYCQIIEGKQSFQTDGIQNSKQNTYQVNNPRLSENQSIKQLRSGEEFIRHSKAISKNFINSSLINQIRISYMIEGKQQKQSKKNSNILNCTIIPQSFSNPQLYQSNILKTHHQIKLDPKRQSIFVGNLKNEEIKLTGNLKGILAQIKFNDICLNDQSIAPMHLEINYSLLTQTNNNYLTLLNQIQQILQIVGAKQMMSYKTIESISNYLQTNKKKLKIIDISQNISNSIYIQILEGQEHSILEEGQKFKIGFQPSLKVEKRYIKLEHYFKKYSNKIHNNNIDLIFDALQSIPYIISFSGIDIVLAELFLLVQNRDIGKKQYLEKFDEDNLMLLNKVEQMLQKSCIQLKTEGDQYKIENFMLVADQKRQFNFGRLEFSDIYYASSQVSRQHGSIEYNEDIDQWTIMDGVYENDRRKPSTFGLWLEVQQAVKIGNTSLLKFDAQNSYFTSQIVNEEIQQQDQYYKQKRKEIDEFITNLLEQ